MITEFEVGKRYRYTHPTRFNAWTKHMDCVTDGKPHLCVKAGGEERKAYALFEGMEECLASYQYGMFCWNSGFGFWEEDTTPKRGDKVVVWDDGCVKSIYDFVSYIEGAKTPYIVTENITKELFECLHFMHCLGADVKLLALSRVCKETSKAFYTAETAYYKASDDYSNHIAKLKEKSK